MSPILALISILFGGDRAQDAEIVPEPAQEAIVVSYQPAQEQPTEGAMPSQRWIGVVELPGQTLGFAVVIESVADRLGGTLDIPMQGLTAGVLRDVSREGDELGFTFEIAGLPEVNWPKWVMTIDETGKAAAGELLQSGVVFPTTMRLDESGEQEILSRPQNPARPLPYREVEVVVDADEHALAGTLTLPDVAKFGHGPYPAVILITGSGPQDRDETLLGHKPFLVLSDHLARHGIAALRYDDRGVGASTGDFSTATTLDFADDVRDAVVFLGEQESIGPIGLIGHSEGGLIAPFVAAGNDEIEFVVLLAAPAVPGHEILMRQTRAIAEAEGASPEMLDKQAKLQTAVFTLVLNGGDESLILAQLQQLVMLQLGTAGVEYDKEILDQYVEQSYQQMQSPWMQQFMTLDPRPMLAKLTQPVLALNGTLDLQVLIDQNIPEINKALDASPSPSYTVAELEGLNHLFQPAITGSVSEYGEIETTFDEGALMTISEWINKHAISK